MHGELVENKDCLLFRGQQSVSVHENVMPLSANLATTT